MTEPYKTDWLKVITAQVLHARTHLATAKASVAFGDTAGVVKALEGVGPTLDSIDFAVDQHRAVSEADLFFADEVVVETVPDTAGLDTLNKGQLRAFNRIKRWIEEDDAADHPYFRLRGPAGTGKTYLMQMLLRYLRANWVFSAPTNKASKVLSRFIKLQARTTFSVLGLRMQHDEDELVMAYGAEKPYFAPGTVLVVDEAGMVNRQLRKFIHKVAKDCGIKVLYVGDPYQLNPVGEEQSEVWKLGDRDHCATLRQVMRNDSQLLELAIKVRKCIDAAKWKSPLKNDHDENKGVREHKTKDDWLDAILAFDKPSDWADRKVVAWRNKTVNRYNDLIRKGFGFKRRFEVGDRLLLGTPMEEDGQIIAHIDDEFEVLEVKEGLERADFVQLQVWQLRVKGDDGEFIFNIPKVEADLESVLAAISTEARHASTSQKKRIAWDRFWRTKGKFQVVRYAYALTSHRVQGTTLFQCFMDLQDILANQNKAEAFRSFMVALTRPTTWLDTF